MGLTLLLSGNNPEGRSGAVGAVWLWSVKRSLRHLSPFHAFARLKSSSRPDEVLCYSCFTNGEPEPKEVKAFAPNHSRWAPERAAWKERPQLAAGLGGSLEVVTADRVPTEERKKVSSGGNQQFAKNKPLEPSLF